MRLRFHLTELGELETFLLVVCWVSLSGLAGCARCMLAAMPICRATFLNRGRLNALCGHLKHLTMCGMCRKASITGTLKRMRLMFAGIALQCAKILAIRGLIALQLLAIS
jgi:hypothetical protein